VVAGIALLILVLTPILPRHGRPEEELMAAGDETPIPREAVLADRS